jgi:hypothetical protein
MRSFVLIVAFVVASLCAMEQIKAATTTATVDGRFNTEQLRPAIVRVADNICAAGQHYACWTEVYGGRFCGCWIGGDRPACPRGYYFKCPVAPNGRNLCGCY